MSVNEKKELNTNSGKKSAFDKALELIKPMSETGIQLVKIGKPSAFSRDVDPKNRIQEYIESKMSVIDLIPCDYLLPLAKAFISKDKDGKIDVIDALAPAISYKQAIERFRIVCKVYGLPDGYGGIRLYLTDDTTSTDEFSSSYTDNILKSAFNSAIDKTRVFRDFGRSVTSAYDEWAREVGGKAGAGAGGLAETVTKQFGLNVDLKNLGASIGAAIAAGNKISLPKLWSDSSYSPNLSAVVKLVSPYGHPSAIKEFIIKPLMYLLIMSAARTSDGISYGQSPKMTVKGYGTANLPLAHISSISLRRGGADTSFNIYRQPLSIDVSLQFQSLMDGFAVFTKETKDKKNVGIYKDTDKIIADLDVAVAGTRALFPTLGTVVDSLRPVAVNTIVTRHNIGSLPKDPGLQMANIGDTMSSSSPKFVEKQFDDNQAPINMNDVIADATKSKSNETAKDQTGALKLFELADKRAAILRAKVNN